MIFFAESSQGWSPFTTAVNLGSLALLTWGVTTEAHPAPGGRHLAALLLLIAAVAGWVVWTAVRTRAAVPLALASLAVVALASGALTAFAPLGIVFVGVAALGAALACAPKRALWVVAAGPLVALLSVWAAGDGLGVVIGAVAASLGGTALGFGRRQVQEHAAQAALVQVSEARADAERARAELLAGRNHMARELHDVLAHTLSALSLQLEALDALISAGPSRTGEVREQLDRTKRLVREGLDEAKGAVRALREDLPPLEEQLARLAGERNAGLHVSGPPRRLDPEVSLALYRVAQEALTNVVRRSRGRRRRAPGLRRRLGHALGGQWKQLGRRRGVSFRSVGARIRSAGDQRAGPLGRRRVEAGPAGGGWVVEAEVPA